MGGVNIDVVDPTIGAELSEDAQGELYCIGVKDYNGDGKSDLEDLHAAQEGTYSNEGDIYAQTDYVQGTAPEDHRVVSQSFIKT